MLFILTIRDALYLYEALGNRLINDINKQPYYNISPLYHDYFVKSTRTKKKKLKC